MKKRGFFFTIDVFIAMIVIVVGFILIWSSMASRTLVTQPYFLSKDTLDFLSTSTNADVSGIDYVNKLINNGTITDLKLTLAEQIALFYYKTTLAQIPSDPLTLNDFVLKNFTRHILENSTPEQYSLEMMIHHMDENGLEINKTLYLQQTAMNKGPSESDSLVSSKTIVSVVIMQGDEFEISPPYVLEVRVWQ
ncbi:MAG: hypothetical protein NT001_04530 [Candidatus Woesearchaeota archaeon]|nr:hypothetical protein [Candidatus Woesearchaeota archaeon]